VYDSRLKKKVDKLSSSNKTGIYSESSFDGWWSWSKSQTI
jgi:hypothetical protein